MQIPSLYTAETAKKYLSKGWWGTRTFPEYLDKQAQIRPDGEAVVGHGTVSPRRLTWQEYARIANRLALGLLEAGIKKGDRVAIYLPGLAEVYLFQTALSKVGALSMSIQLTFLSAEVQRLLNIGEVVGIVTLAEWRGVNYVQMMDELRSSCPELRYHFVVGDKVPTGTISVKAMLEATVEDRYPQDYLQPSSLDPSNDISYMLATSGTTGPPKVLVLNMNRWVPFANVFTNALKLTSDDVIFCLVPQCGLWGLWFNNQSLLVGCKNVMQERFDAEEALRIVEQEKVTVLVGVPTQYIMILEVPDFDKYDLSSLRAVFSAGASIAPETVKQVETKLRCPFVSFYGTSEAGTQTAVHIDDPPEKRWHTVGRIPYPVQTKIFGANDAELPQGKVGEIGSRGPLLSGGYYKDPEAQKELLNSKGWMVSGDLAVMGEDGYVRIVGRKKDIIIRGGQNIAATEVEDLIFAHPKVANVAVVAMPDPKMGEKCCAYVVPKTGEEISLEELVAFLKDKGLAKFKLPERLEIVSELPLSSGGKVLKRQLREDIVNKLSRERQGRGSL